METIPFLVTVPEEDVNDEMGIFRPADGDVRIQQIPVETLKHNLTAVSQSVMGALGDIKQVGQFRLQEVKLQVEVTVDGGINLIGTANLGGKGAITLKFAET
ncbi:MAG: hypothetical protein AAGF95_19115 [Chloroflexota bacterium]